MRFTALTPRMSPLLPLCLVLLLAGCADERGPLAPTRPTGAVGLTDALRPGQFQIQESQGRLKPDLSNIWPNDDGRHWLYRIRERSWGDFSANLRTYPTAAAVPPSPSPLEVASILRWNPIGANPVFTTAGYRMQFKGMKTTASGAVGQNLETTILEVPGPVGSALSGIAAAGVPAGFLRSLSVARPDLAAKIAARWPAAIRTQSAAAAAASVQSPTFLFGYAWEKTSEYIGSYGDLDANLAWKYLVADLSPGSEFTMQLVPELANDVFLHARVLRGQAPTADAGSFRKAVQVLYVLDYGVSTVTDANGNALGYFRVYSYGTVAYVPGVGPVASYERALVQPGTPLDSGVYDQSIALVETAAGSPTP